MPSIAVDQSGNTVIGYSTSDTTIFPSIRYAGRLVSDPPGNLAQGEAVMFAGVGPQQRLRWGDYTRTEVDPSDGMYFCHINQYAQSGDWHTRIGKFNFAVAVLQLLLQPLQHGDSVELHLVGGTKHAQCRNPHGGCLFPGNGKFYAMGGRSPDTAGSEFTHPFEYDPVSNSWTIKSATYPDNQVNNMACGVLTDAGTPYIYCVGGRAVTIPRRADRVFRYNPVTDMISPVAAPWPPVMGIVLPGGFTVFNNKLYILGGFDTITNGGQATDKIWEFT